MLDCENKFKGFITSAIGTITMVLTLFLVWQRVIGFVWEGIAGLSIGCILFMAPQSVERIVSRSSRYFGRNNSQDDTENVTTPPNPPRKI